MERREDELSAELKNILIQTLREYEVTSLESKGEAWYATDGKWEVGKLTLLIELEKL